VVEVAEVFFEVSVETTQSVVAPFVTVPVFQGMEYNVPLAVEIDPISVLEAREAPRGP
jgi:hypothetical protein